ncbi:2-hydroxychromene-2-carboxylate isomerase [Kordiimonas sediminis]|uniref:2-hydroxychromene-2-carboxylate isomerase n=1 Tax=Kordiimonas sediminis TaxID=1735581 RepID=A0A919AYU3_9PROT|nr:DsbA family protein [Kordiimonas sediminis]GHF30083.1 2-hydroxychromene-2-carboxylate isomerase [Kordiimonas sediminis]
MTVKTFLRASAARLLTSESLLSTRRFLTEAGRRVSRKRHQLVYFHRVDDPYCQLMVQSLPMLQERFDIDIIPKVIERLPANMYPDPQRYEAYSILDASRLAHLYGLGFPDGARVPDRLGVGMASMHLAAQESHPDFFAMAADLGAAVWRQDIPRIRNSCAVADMDDTKIRANEALLRQLGHYTSGSVFYGGEFYVGLDRLDHLERRLNSLGAGDGEVHFELARLWRYQLDELDRSIAGRTVEMYFSIRSPYSYIALHQAAELAEKTSITLRLKPVLPMVMRGLPVPAAKRWYILQDAAREARIENIPFGFAVDPLGLATERAMAVGFRLMEEGRGLPFFLSFMQAVWAEGVDGTTDKGLAYALREVGEDQSWISNTMDDDLWRARAEANRQEMLSLGSWGVPTFRVGPLVTWGQDRLWAVVEALKSAP